MSEAVPKNNPRGRGPAYPVPSSGSSNLPQHGGEGKTLNKSGNSKVGLNKGMSGTQYSGPGRIL